MSFESVIDTLEIRNANKISFVGTSSSFVDTTTGRIQTKGIQHNSNVITDVSGPHGRVAPTLKKYPEIIFADGKFDRNDTTNTYVQAGYTVSASDQNIGSSRYVWKLFDNLDGSDWGTSGGSFDSGQPGVASSTGDEIILADTTTHTRGHWAKIKFPNKIIISTYTLNSTSTDRRPASISILGSNDDTEWYIIKDVHAVGSQDEYSISVNATTAYKYIMFMVHSIIGSDNQMKIGDLKFYGYEEYTPAGDHSVDTTFKSRFNNPQLTGVQVLVDGNAGQLGANQISGGADPSGGDQATYVTDGKYWTLNGTLTSNLSVEANTFLEGDQPHAVSVWFNSSNLEANVSNTCVFSVSDQEKLDSVNLDLQSNTWHNLTYAYQGEGGSRVTYLDGRKVAEDQAEDTFGEYPPFAMTGYSQGGYVVSADSEHSSTSWFAYEAFSKITSGTNGHLSVDNNYYNDSSGGYTRSPPATIGVLASTGATINEGDWLKIEMPNKIIVDYISQISLSDRPKDFKWYGSNDDYNWTQLLSVVDAPNNTNTNSFIATTRDAFRYFALVVSRVYTYPSLQYWRLDDVRLYGHRENDLVRLPDPINVLKYPHFYFGNTTADTARARRGYVISSSGEYQNGADANHRMWRPFHDLSGDGSWLTDENPATFDNASPGSAATSANYLGGITGVSGNRPGPWLKLELPHKIKFSYAHIYKRGHPSLNPGIKTGYIYGSNNDSTWTTIGTINESSPSYTTTTPLIVTSTDTTNAYKYIVIQVTLMDQQNTVFGLGKLEYYGTGVDSIPIQIGGGNIDKVANFRVYDKFIGEDQALEIWDAQKEEFGRAKPQMVLQQGKLGIGTDAPQGSLSVADEPDPTTYGLQEFPPKPLVGYKTHIEGHGEFCVSEGESAYSGGTNYNPWNLFTKQFFTGSWQNSTWNTQPVFDAGNGLITASDKLGNFPGTWIQLQLPYKIKLEKITISVRGVWFEYGPEDYVIVAYDEDTTSWIELASYIGETWNNIGDVEEIKYKPINSTSYYRKYAIVVSRLYNPNNNRSDLNIAEWKLFGTREQLPPKQSVLHDGQLTLTKNLNVPRIGPALDADDTPRRDRLVVEYNTSTNPTFEGAVRDTSGRGLDGVFYGGASYDASVKALVFDGTGDYIEGPVHNSAGEWLHSVSMWFKRNASDSYDVLFHLGKQSAGKTSSMRLFSDNRFRFNFYDADIEASYTVNNGTWYHLAFSYSGGTDIANRKIYLNGAELTVTTSGTPVVLNLDANEMFTLATQRAIIEGQMNCDISNFKLYDTVLTASEVKTLYDMGRCDEGGHVVNFSKTRVGIGLGDGEAPRSALDVRDLIYAESSSVQTFTGQHICFPDESMEKGLVVSAKKNQFVKLNGLATGKSAITIDESLPIVSLSNVAQDKACFGVVSKMEETNTAYRTEITGGLVSESIKIAGDNRAVVNSVGEGAIWVVDTNGPLESGDYITTSNVAGYGQKQDDDVLHNFTVAKITMDCDFTASNVAVQTIKREQTGTQIITEDAWNQLVEYDRYSNVEDEITTYYQVQRGGNVLDENGQLQFEDKTGATEEPYERRFLTTDGTQTDEANAAHIAAFVGCTYHCG